MNSFLVLPIVIPLATAVSILMLRPRAATANGIALGGAGLHLLACGWVFHAVRRGGILAAQAGGWPAPFGITLAADHLRALMVVITAVVHLAVVADSRADEDAALSRRAYYPLMQILTGGICGAFLAGDLFNLYVWFEVMLMASFGLLVLGGEKAQLDGGVKYVVINLFSTLLLLAGIALLYGMTGTLNLADLHGKVHAIPDRGLVTAVAMMFMAAFGIKSAMFPLFFWLPASYHTPPVPVAAYFAGLLTKVGVYSLIKVFTLVFVLDTGYPRAVLLYAALLTMVTGVLGAAAQGDFRRILSFHIISQVGYMLLGLALDTTLALAGAVFYLVHHILVKANLFLVAGVVRRLTGAFDLAHLGGVYRTHKWVALLFFIPAFSLAGFPPLSGFWAKMILIRASLDTHRYLVAGIAAAVGLLTVYSMTKIWGEAFWKPAPGGGGAPPPPGVLSAWMLTPVAFMAAMTVVIGLGAEPVFEVALQAAEELRQPQIYVDAVLRSR